MSLQKARRGTQEGLTLAAAQRYEDRVDIEEGWNVNVREDLLRTRIDPALTPQALSKIAAEALGAGVRVQSWRPLTGGCWNRVILLQGDPGVEKLIVKISPSSGDAGIQRDYAVLRWFAEHTHLPVPRALLVDASGDRIPGSLLVMSRIPGKTLHAVYGGLDADEQRRITVTIARDLTELHQTTAHGFGGVELPETERRSWASFWLPRFDSVMREVAESGLVERRFLDRIEKVRPDLARILDIGEQSTLTHYDIWSGNVMVDGAGGKATITGYLDVPGYWADPVRELSFAEMFGIANRLFYEVYTSVHRLPDGWQVRRDLYNLKMHLKHITMYPGERYYREGAARCLETVEVSM